VGIEWDSLCRVLVTRCEPCLRKGVHGGWRRAVLAAVLWRTRRHWSFFYTVQAPRDEKRLRGGGTPWPTGETEAHLGPGVYAWKLASDARSYRRILLPQVPDVRILRFMVLRRRFQSLTRIDVNLQPDPDAWMNQYSLLGTGPLLPHGAQYIRRHTGVPRGNDTAVEHYFSSSVFRSFSFFEGNVRAN
jgi:hypothetical protein